MAVVAFGRALRYGAVEQQAARVSCTAGLATDRPKRGSHRADVAVQTANQTRHWSLELEKEARSRQEEEKVVSGMVLNAMAEACGVEQRLELPLLDHERVETEQVHRSQAWQDLFLGRVEAIRPLTPAPLPRTAREKHALTPGPSPEYGRGEQVAVTPGHSPASGRGAIGPRHA